MHKNSLEDDLNMVLHTFLRYCENSKLEKEIVDCGAGGETPPLYIFYMFGYKTHGIDISEEQVKRAHAFCKEKGIDLRIEKGDMRDLPFDDLSISFVYSYDTIFHMPKKEVSIAMEEMKRVLKKDGLLYVNFVSTDHSGFGKGQEVGAGEFIQDGRAKEKILISYYKDNEPDQYFNGFEILLKEKRIREFTRRGVRALGFDVDGEKYIYASLDYVAKKR